MKNKFYSCLSVLVAMSLLFACEKTPELNTSESGNEGVNVQIKLTDAPIELDAVNIDIQTVTLYIDEGTHNLATDAGVYNLLDWQNGLSTALGSEMLEFETLKAIRLVLGENNTVVVDGVMHELKVPGGQNAGLKVLVGLPSEDLSDMTLTIDFDAEKSVKLLGNGTYMLLPVLKVIDFNGQGFNGAATDGEDDDEDDSEAVSYTHLTLPTNREV